MKILKQKSKSRNMSRKDHVPFSMHRPKETHTPLRIASFCFMMAMLGLNLIPLFGDTKDVLAISTNTTISVLLSETNKERAVIGASALTLNTTLNSSAQAKAQDMVTTNYWAHNRPDGTPPWNFFTNAGYSGSKLGENLAYGQMSSKQVVEEWMDSTSHRENMLDKAYCEVGFGIADSQNFISKGPETIVAAHYAAPAAGCGSLTPTPPAATTAATPPATPPVAPRPTTPAVVPPATPEVTPPPATPTDAIQPATPVETTVTPQAANTETYAPVQEVRSSRASTLFHSQAAQGVVLSMLAIALLAYAGKHALGLRRVISTGESWVLHHPAVDFTILGIIFLLYFLSQTVGGTIR